MLHINVNVAHWICLLTDITKNYSIFCWGDFDISLNVCKIMRSKCQRRWFFHKFQVTCVKKLGDGDEETLTIHNQFSFWNKFFYFLIIQFQCLQSCTKYCHKRVCWFGILFVCFTVCYLQDKIIYITLEISVKILVCLPKPQ